MEAEISPEDAIGNVKSEEVEVTTTKPSFAGRLDISTYTFSSPTSSGSTVLPRRIDSLSQVASRSRKRNSTVHFLNLES